MLQPQFVFCVRKYNLNVCTFQMSRCNNFPFTIYFYIFKSFFAGAENVGFHTSRVTLRAPCRLVPRIRTTNKLFDLQRERERFPAFACKNSLKLNLFFFLRE